MKTPEEDKEDTAKDTGVYIGDDEYGDTVNWNPQDAGAVPNPHLMIMGESGSGKTYAVQCLVAELAQRSIPSILFDYGQSFELQHLEEPFTKFTGIKEHLIGASCFCGSSSYRMANLSPIQR
jgi:polynucleotide 5'-kinase involved in rRNA processing